MGRQLSATVIIILMSILLFPVLINRFPDLELLDYKLHFTMLLPTLLLAAFADAQIAAGLNQLRFGCSQITIERLDPLVNPGVVGTPHTHQVVGGNAFNASIPSTDVSTISTCTTCGPSDDRSNYWTANVYFKARNGTYKRVPQMPNR